MRGEKGREERKGGERKKGRREGGRREGGRRGRRGGEREGGEREGGEREGGEREGRRREEGGRGEGELIAMCTCTVGQHINILNVHTPHIAHIYSIGDTCEMRTKCVQNKVKCISAFKHISPLNCLLCNCLALKCTYFPRQ